MASTPRPTYLSAMPRGRTAKPSSPSAGSSPNARITKVAGSSVRRYSREFLNVLRRNTKAGERWVSELDHAAHDGPLVAAWLGHASVLIRLGEHWILTDPVFSQRIGVRVGPMTFGVGRLTPAFDHGLLPPIDLILISHAHFDHLDVPTLRKLASPRTHVITAANTRRLIPFGFASVRELAWDEELRDGPLHVSAFRPAHWGARTAWDRHRGFNSYVLSTAQHRVLYAGDTAYTDAYRRVGDAGGVDLAIFGIGAYDPWIQAHANPEQVWEMSRQAKAKWLLPIHHSTFKLSDEPINEPLERLFKVAGPEADRVVASTLGQLWTPGHTITVTT